MNVQVKESSAVLVFKDGHLIGLRMPNGTYKLA
jgi:hypothetical protein